MLRPTGEKTYLLGNFGDPPIISVYLIADDDHLVLVDPGPRSITEEVIEGIRGLGFDPRDLNLILLTHVHLDHSGGAWYLLEKIPNAKVIVHPAGMKHLIDPTRLLTSSREVLGEAFYEMGEVRPCDPSKVSGASNSQRINLNKTSVILHFTAGHAPHHLSIFEEKDRVLFSGDALGIYYDDCKALIPASPLPSFDYDMAMRDMDYISSLKPVKIALPHFGTTSNIDDMLNLNRMIYSRWLKVVSNCVMKNIEIEGTTEALLHEFSEYKGISSRKDRLRNMKVDVAGFLSYIRKKSQKKV